MYRSICSGGIRHYNHRIGNAANITALQIECESITAPSLGCNRNINPQNAPAIAAAKVSMKFIEEICERPHRMRLRVYSR